jgi:hypothetical protein
VLPLVSFVVVVLLTVRGLISRRVRVLRWAMYTSIGFLLEHDVYGPDGRRVDVPALLDPGDVWASAGTVMEKLDRVEGPCRGTFVIREGFDDVKYSIGDM